MAEKTFVRELKWLLPFFILHLGRYSPLQEIDFPFSYFSGRGINGNFTTVLIKHYNDLVRDQEEVEDSLRDAVIGIIQDIPPIIFAVANIGLALRGC